MEGDENAAAIVTASGIAPWKQMPKDEVATRLARRLAEDFASRNA